MASAQSAVFQSPAAEAADMTFSSNASQAKRFEGTVKSFNEQKGYGFIDCDLCRQKYTRDVFFLKTDIPGGFIHKGAEVTFLVNIVEGKPQAAQIWLSDVDSNVCGWQGAKSGIVYDEQKGIIYNKNAVPNTTTQERGQEARGQGSCAFIFGKVKSFSTAKGSGLITSKQYENDIFVTLTSLSAAGAAQKGQSVIFNLKPATPRPQADNVVAVKSSYVGSVKFYNVQKGWGFVTSPEAQEFGDVFLHAKDVEGQAVVAGMEVRFAIEENWNGKPQAKDVVLSSAGFQGAGRACAVSTQEVSDLGDETQRPSDLGDLRAFLENGTVQKVAAPSFSCASSSADTRSTASCESTSYQNQEAPTFVPGVHHDEHAPCDGVASAEMSSALDVVPRKRRWGRAAVLSSGV